MPTIYVPPTEAGVDFINNASNASFVELLGFSAIIVGVNEGTGTKFLVNLGETVVTFRGTDFQYNSSLMTNIPVWGTLTDINVKVSGVTTLTWTGLNLRIPDLLDANHQGQDAFAKLLFGKSDIFRLTDQADIVNALGGNDIVNANGGSDQVWGGTGNDRLNGGKGDDILRGDAGKDKLAGGIGLDSLTGGAGDDQFIFTISGPTNRKTITDFTSAADKLVFDNDVFTGLVTEGVLAADAFALGTKAADASDRLIYNQATGSLWYDRDGKGGSGQTLIAELQDGAALVASDILII